MHTREYEELLQDIKALKRRLGTTTVTGGGGSGSFAPTSAEYVVLANSASLTAERRLVAGTGITLTDGGANGDVQVAVDVDSLSFGSPSPFAPANASYVTMSNTGNLSDERRLVAGSGITITDGGANGDVTIAGTGSGGGSGFGTVPTSGWTGRNSIIYNEYITPVSLGIYIVDNVSLNLRTVTRTLPANTYTLIATFRHGPGGANSTACGIYLFDGTKYIGFELLNQSSGSGGIYRLRVQRYTNATTASTTDAGPTANITAYPATLKIVQDVTNRTYYYYSNGAFTQFFQHAANTFLTETDAGFGGISNIGNNVSAVLGELIQWSAT